MRFRPTNNTSATDLIGPALLGWTAGTALHLQCAELPSAGVLTGWLGAAVVAWLLVGFCVRKLQRAGYGLRPLALMVLVLLAQAALAFSLCGLRAGHFATQALPAALEGQDLRITGEITAMPQRTADGTRFRVAVQQATREGRAVRLPPRIDLGWYAADGAAQEVPDLRAGDRWDFTVRLKAPHGSSNPFGFDYELWLWEQGVQATGYVRAGSGAPPVRVSQGWSHPVERARQAVRDAVFASVAHRPSAGVIAALVTGDQNAIERTDWDVFRATGVAHLMSISGLHITLFAWLAAAVAGAVWRRSSRLCLLYPAPLAALLAGVALATAYAVFSGWGVPSQRTVWMLAAVGALRLAARRWPWPHVWLLACAVVVTFDPWALLQAGFWLSFVAVGVLFASDAGTPGGPRGTARVPADPLDEVVAPSPPAWHERLLSPLRKMLREQLIVTLALAPLTLLLFQQVSLVGLLANLVAIPWVTLVVTPLAMLGVVWPPLWQAASAAIQALAWGLSHLAGWPLATVSLPLPPGWAGAAGVLGGVLLVLRLPWPLRALALPLLLPALLWQAPRPVPGAFELLAADIGQGNAVLVRTARHTLLYDTGPRFSRDADAGDRVLVPLLRALGERLDTVVVSHRDIDHAGGARAVLTMQPQAGLLSSIEPGHELQALRPATRCEAGQRWTWDGVAFEVLHPLASDYEKAPRPNALSCVLRVTALAGPQGDAAVSALLAGDVEQPQEAALLARSQAASGAAALHADVLLVPHHGSKTSSSDAFLDAVSPRLAVVQAGYRNRFGHPASPVLARYEAHGIRVADNVHCGAVHWASWAPDKVVCQRDLARRYWHHRAP